MDDFDILGAINSGPAASPKPAPVRNNNPGALMPGGKLAQYPDMETGLAAMDKNLQSYGKQGVNTLSGVISKWAPSTENNTQAYISDVSKRLGIDPNQQIDLSDPAQRRALATGIMLHENGPAGVFKSSGRSAQAPASPSPSNALLDFDLSPKSLSTPPSMSAATGNSGIRSTSETQKSTTTPESGPISSTLHGMASVADTVMNAVPGVAGMVAYPVDRAFRTVAHGLGFNVEDSPQAAAADTAKVTNFLTNPVGKAFGVENTQGYQNEATHQLMQFIGNNWNKGAEWIAQKTGLPVEDVNSYMQSSTLMLPKAANAGSNAVKTATTAIKNAATSTVRTANDVMRTVADPTFPYKIGSAAADVANIDVSKPGIPQSLKDVFALKKQSGTAYDQARATYSQKYASAGAAAAATPDMARSLVASSSPELQATVDEAIKAGKPINMDALQRHIDGDSLPVPVKFTEGQALHDPELISNELNNRGRHEEMVQFLSDQNKALVDNFQAMRERVAPDVYTNDMKGHGETVINAYRDLDHQMRSEIDAKYQAVRDANGGNLPVDVPTLINNIRTSLAKEMNTYDVPPGLERTLGDIEQSGHLDLEQYLALRRNAGNSARTLQDGNQAHAAGIVAEELDALPMLSDASEHVKALAEEARAAARSRFQMLDRKNANYDPAFADAINPNAVSDTFLQRHLVNAAASTDKVSLMMRNLSHDPIAQQTVARAAVDALQNSGVKSGNFAQASYNKALTGLQTKLPGVMGYENADILGKLGEAGYTANMLPKGHYVNTSNSATSLLGLVKAIPARAAEGLANLHTAGVGGTLTREWLNKKAAAKQMQESLKPGAGITKH